MRREKTLLLIGHPTEGVLTAKSLGLDVILFQHKSKFAEDQARYSDVMFLIDYTDSDTALVLADVAQRTWGFSAALSLTDSGVELAGRINDLYDLGGTGFDVSHLLRDKWAMRRRLAGAGLPTVGAMPVNGRESLQSFADAYGYPFIMKPADLSGGFGVRKVSGPGDLDAAWQRLRNWQESGMGKGPSSILPIGGFLMEEFVDGPEYSIEAFSFAGRHVVIAVTEKLIDDQYFAELGHIIPARVPTAVEQEIVAAVTRFLDVAGVTDGPTHTEIRLSPSGPVVIESHNRAGGGRIKDLIQAVYGIDLTRYIVGWPFGLVDDLPGRPEPAGGACVRFLYGAAGRVEAVHGITDARDHPGVIAAESFVAPGDEVRPLRDNFDRLALVAVRGADSDAAFSLCDELLGNLVRVDVAGEYAIAG
jgi:biotin carboxylase